MVRRSRTSLLVAVSSALMIAVAFWGPGSADGHNDRESGARDGKSLPRPIVDTHHLMELFNQPLYKNLKQQMQQEPAQQQQWDTLHQRGLQAAEVMNLVAIRDRDDATQSDWLRHARTAQETGLQLAEAAESRNWNATQQAYQGLIRNCNGCHQQIAPDHAPQLSL
jgi:hypothetical protein